MTRTAILEFVATVTNEGGPGYVPPEDRIATFDNDGTLWAEKPLYIQMNDDSKPQLPASREPKPSESNVSQPEFSTPKVFRSRWLEITFWVVGLMLISFYAAVRVEGEVARRAAIERFKADSVDAAQPGSEPGSPAALGLQEGAEPDVSLWSAKRIALYREALSQRFEFPLAILEIPKLSLTVPVLDGTDDLRLNRGVGRIQGSARPGEAGNVGIAGHRDGFFRGLKDITSGDLIHLRTAGGVDEYVVDETLIVEPEDVHVLHPRSLPTLTLVTCFPFYVAGSAPQRYIVHATLKDSSSSAQLGGAADGHPSAEHTPTDIP